MRKDKSLFHDTNIALIKVTLSSVCQIKSKTATLYKNCVKLLDDHIMNTNDSRYETSLEFVSQ